MRESRHIVFVANLLFSFSLAITAYTNSSFIESTTSTQAVGVLYAFSALLSIIALMQAPRTLAALGNRKFFLSYGTLHALSLALLVLPVGRALHIASFLGYLFSGNILIFSFDALFEGTSAKAGKGTARGTFLMLGNCGWVLAPLITSHIVDNFGFAGTYAVAFFVFMIIALLIGTRLSKYREPKYTPHQKGSALRRAFKIPTLRVTIIANFILQFFYAWMVVYSPLYLHDTLGLAWDTIGILFSIMLTAFVIFDYPLGKLADFLGSEKELTAIGFIIMATSVLGLALIESPSIFVIGLLLFFSRVGAATVEAMTEIHFFKIAGAADSSILSIFRDLRPLAYLIAPLCGAVILYTLPFESLFFILTFILVLGYFLSFHLERKTKWWTRSHAQ